MTWLQGDNLRQGTSGVRVTVLGTTKASKVFEGRTGRVVVGGSYSVLVCLDALSVKPGPTLRFFCEELRYENIVDAVAALDEA